MIAYLEEAAGIFRAVEDVPRLSLTLTILGTYLPAAEVARARALADEALELARGSGEPFAIAGAEQFAGMSLIAHNGGPAAARSHLEEALRLARALDADWLTMHALFNLASLAQREGRRDEARRLWPDVRPLAEAFHDRWEIAYSSIYLALLSSDEGDYEQAAAE